MIDIDVVCASSVQPTSVVLFAKHLEQRLGERGLRWRMIVVDDGDDDSVAVLRRRAEDGLPLQIYHRRPAERIGGFSGAIAEGIAASDARVVAVVDPDLTITPESLINLVDPLLSGRADVVVGVPVRRAMTLWHRLPLSMTTAATKILFREARRFRRPSSDVFACRRDVLSGVVLSPERFRVLIEILVRGNWSRGEESEYDGAAELRSGRIRPRTVFLFASRLVRLWLDTRINPMGVAEHRRERGSWPAPSPTDDSSTGPLDVLMVASEVPPVVSGVSRSVARLGAELETLGHHVTYRSSNDAWRGSIGEFRATTLGWSLLRPGVLERFDVVVLHGPVPTMTEVLLLGLRLRPAARRPRVVYVHHFDVEIQFLGVPSLVYNLVLQRLARCADHVVVTSPSYSLAQKGRSSASVSVVPWGVDITGSADARAPFLGDRPLRVLFIGQQRPYKGISNLIAAVAGSSVLQLTVVGSGPLEAQHRLLALRLDADNVNVIGRVDDAGIDALFADHDVIALPSVSRLEAFGMVLLEGMQAGCVPVASDLPGVRDVVGDAGLLVPPRRVLTLRNELESLARDPSEVQRRSAASVARAQSFSWSRTRRGYEAVLTQLGRPTN